MPLEHFALEATGTVTLSPGTYTLRTISDDAVRVWVDGWTELRLEIVRGPSRIERSDGSGGGPH